MKTYQKAAAIILTLILVFSCIPLVSAAEAETVPAPIAWYTFDDPQNLGADSSGNGNHLQAMGTPTSAAGGKYGNAVHFDGASALSAAQGADGSDFLDALAGTTNKFTLTFWLKTTKEDLAGYDPANWRRIVSNGADWGMSGGGAGGFTLINNPDNPADPGVMVNNPVFHLNNNDTNIHVYAEFYPVHIQYSAEWNHVAVTVDAAANRIQYYLNGNLMADHQPQLPEGTALVFANAAAPFSFGAGYSAGTSYLHSFVGSVDQAGVFDTVLTQEQIALYMASSSGVIETEEPWDAPVLTFDSKYTQPAAWYTFDHEENRGVDLSGNGNDLKTAGNPTFEAVENGSTVHFDGSSAMYAKPGEGGLDFVDKLAQTTGQITLTFRFKTTKADMQGYNPANWRRIVSNGADWGMSGGGATGFTLINNPDDPANPGNVVLNPVAHFDNNDANIHLYAETYKVQAEFNEAWHFVAVTMDEATGRIQYYLDGKLVADITPNLPAGATCLDLANVAAPFAFGAAYNPANPDLTFMHSFVGSLDDAGVFGKVLSAEEIGYYMNYGADVAPETGESPALGITAALMALSAAAFVLLAGKKRAS